MTATIKMRLYVTRSHIEPNVFSVEKTDEVLFLVSYKSNGRSYCFFLISIEPMVEVEALFF